MLIDDRFFEGYENSRLITYDKLEENGIPSVAYSDLGSFSGEGVLKSSRYVDGKLVQTYTPQGNHVCVIAGTRLGKTTSYVIPTVLSFARQQVKKPMLISDPKGEIYRCCAQTLEDEGYRIILLNFRDYMHSERWNPLTPIFRAYRAIDEVENEVEIVGEGEDARYTFRGRVYEDDTRLARAVEGIRFMRRETVRNMIDNLTSMFITTKKDSDPYWEDSARDVCKAFIWAMLEDSDLPEDNPNRITEDTFSFNTILSVIATFSDDDSALYDDGGYFTSRGSDSPAYRLAKNNLIENGKPTRKCILSCLFTKLSVFSESSVRMITACNSFEMSELAGDRPVAVFINFRDELRSGFELISLFVQDAYRVLIERANSMPDGKLAVPFYFILDEFGNFAKLTDFETTISACAGRNIFFCLIIQSYAQLNNVYGSDVAEIIRDNLNVHVFFGSNNPSTLEEFSRECGERRRISPLTALSGQGKNIQGVQLETVPLVTKSRLSRLEEGEAVVTEANSGYVLFSKLVRYFRCEEFGALPRRSAAGYECAVDPCDEKYVYRYKRVREKRSW